MDLISELEIDFKSFERCKEILQVGIFGSFRRDFLQPLKNHLVIKERFNAKISYDLAKKYLRNHDESESAYDFRLAHALIEESRIHIFLFFREEHGEEGINDSAIMEIGMLYSCHTQNTLIGRYSLVFCESGYDTRNIGGMRRGIRSHTDNEWRWHDFESYEEVQLHATQFCYDCLMDYYMSELYE
jgi:hypothetical protein